MRRHKSSRSKPIVTQMDKHRDLNSRGGGKGRKSRGRY